MVDKDNFILGRCASRDLMGSGNRSPWCTSTLEFPHGICNLEQRRLRSGKFELAVEREQIAKIHFVADVAPKGCLTAQDHVPLSRVLQSSCWDEKLIPSGRLYTSIVALLLSSSPNRSLLESDELVLVGEAMAVCVVYQRSL